jgi:aldehyde:ferredoxin oxidoreductase
MASKNLKAIATRGTKGVTVADPEKFMKISNSITKRILNDPDLKTWRQFGGRYTSTPKFTSEEYFLRIWKKSYACPSCPVGCKQVIDLRDGTNKELSFRLSHLSSQISHGRLAFMEGWDELVKGMEALNRYGLETSSTTAMLNFIVECSNHGLLKEEEMRFRPRLGGDALRELIAKITTREGIGNLAAEGLILASQGIKGSTPYAQHAKGVGRENNLDRAVNLGNIGTLLSPRGGKPETSQIPFGEGGAGEKPETYRTFCKDLGLGKETTDRVCDGPDGYNVGRLLKWTQDYNTLYTSVGFCIRAIIMRHTNLKEISELYEAATGLEVNPDQLLVAGERVFNVLKAFNVKAGATRLDDMPNHGNTWDPDKPLVVGDKKYGSLNHILSQYYDERGWDVITGIPTKEKLSSLGLESIIVDLY